MRWRGPVEHLFFHTLVMRPRLAFRDDAFGRSLRDYFVTVREFRSILRRMYANRWTLVDLHRVDRGAGARAAGPAAVRPVRRRRQLLRRTGAGAASGTGSCSMRRARCAVEERVGRGRRVTGNDLVPIVDDFVARHPLFSAEGAKGVLALTGYQGLFGERIQQPGPGRAAALRRARAVAARLRATGWTFASHTYGHIDLSRTSAAAVQADSDRVGAARRGRSSDSTDVLIYPFGARPPAGSETARVLRRAGFTIQCDIDVGARLTRADDVSFMSRRHIDGLALTSQEEALRPPLAGSCAKAERRACDRPKAGAIAGGARQRKRGDRTGLYVTFRLQSAGDALNPERRRTNSSHPRTKNSRCRRNAGTQQLEAAALAVEAVRDELRTAEQWVEARPAVADLDAQDVGRRSRGARRSCRPAAPPWRTAFVTSSSQHDDVVHRRPRRPARRAAPRSRARATPGRRRRRRSSNLCASTRSDGATMSNMRKPPGSQLNGRAPSPGVRGADADARGDRDALDGEHRRVVGLRADLEVAQGLVDARHRVGGVADARERALAGDPRRSAPSRRRRRTRRRCRARARRRARFRPCAATSRRPRWAPSIGENSPTGRTRPSLASSGSGWPAQTISAVARPSRSRSSTAATEHSDISSRATSSALRMPTASSGSSSSCAAVRSVCRARPVSAAASAPRPATSPTRASQPPRTANAS